MVPAPFHFRKPAARNTEVFVVWFKAFQPGIVWMDSDELACGFRGRVPKTWSDSGYPGQSPFSAKIYHPSTFRTPLTALDGLDERFTTVQQFSSLGMRPTCIEMRPKRKNSAGGGTPSSHRAGFWPSYNPLLPNFLCLHRTNRVPYTCLTHCIWVSSKKNIVKSAQNYLFEPHFDPFLTPTPTHLTACRDATSRWTVPADAQCLQTLFPRVGARVHAGSCTHKARANMSGCHLQGDLHGYHRGMRGGGLGSVLGFWLDLSMWQIGEFWCHFSQLGW
jgi:hypothetical protein